MTVWIDGIRSRTTSISVLDQTFLRGDGCFEALRSYLGRPFDLDGHLDRLERSASALEMSTPPRRDLAGWLTAAAAECGDCVLRLVVTRGSMTEAGHVVIIAEPLPEKPAAFLLATVEAPWHPAGRSWDLAGVKSVSYAPNMAATRRAVRRGAHDALLVSDGTLLEGPTFSIGWIVDGTLETPTLDLGVLASVTRKHVLRLAAEAGVAVVEGTWDVSRLWRADEVMAWSTIKEVSPVARVDDEEYPIGPVTEQLAKSFADAISR